MAKAVLSRICAVLFAIYIASMAPAFANSEEENGDLLANALAAIEDEDWIAAEHFGSQISDSVGADLILWSRLREGEASWSEYLSFLEDHGDWPGLKRLRRAGEAAIPKGANQKLVRDYFAVQPPQTGTGALRLAEALQSIGRTADARKQIQDAWINLSLTGEEQFSILDNFGGLVRGKNEARLDALLWAGRTKEAERMFELVSPDQVRLAKARIGLQRATKNVDILIADVPSRLANDPGLAHDRFVWRVKKDRWDAAEEILLERSVKGAELGKAEAWSNRRRIFARRAMREGKAQKAYQIASMHGLSEGSNFADLEWLSGYLSLRYLNNPERALQHFQNFSEVVKTPISIGRAGYWIGRAYEQLGRYNQAAVAYETGANHQTGFYGQLAAEKLGADPDRMLTGRERFADWRLAEFTNHPVLRASILLHYADEPHMVRWFMAHMAETMDRKELLQLAELALEIDRPYVALGIAKEATKRSIVLHKSYFPVTDLASFSPDVEAEIAMSIARRESELFAGAVSPAGARGLMQVMPATARKVAKDLGIEYSKARLTNDWRYNATLGTAYLSSLIDQYDGSYILAFAAYNAGPSRADRWIEEYGDPRSANVDPIDWIEHIPFRETRNYVMRVIESLHVYRARVRGKTERVSLSADLSRG